MSVALVIQCAVHMHRITLSSLGCLALPYSSTLSQKRHDLRKIIVEREMCLDWARYYRNVHRSSCKAPVILNIFWSNLYLLDRFSKNTQISNFMNIHSLGVQLFLADGRTDRQTKTKLIVAFRNLANAPQKNGIITLQKYLTQFYVRNLS